MSADRSDCEACGARILKRTAARCGGLCMPCFKARNYGLTPYQQASLAEAGLESFHAQWVASQRGYRRFGSVPTEVGRHCVPLICADIEGYISAFFRHAGRWNDIQTRLFALRCADLEDLYRQLDGPLRNYLGALFWFCLLIQDAVREVETVEP